MVFYSGPPTSVAFSDNVIGSVVQRGWAVRDRMTAGDSTLNRMEDVQNVSPFKQRTQRQTYRQAPYVRLMKESMTNLSVTKSKERQEVSSSKPLLDAMVNFIGQTDSRSGEKRRSLRPSDFETANQIISSIQDKNYRITPELQAAIVTDALKKKIQHREQCRVNQARYRQRQKKICTDIRDQITQLRTEIKDLELRCEVPSRVPKLPTLWGLAAKYFLHFQTFLASPVTHQAAAANFLQGICTPDVADGSLVGVENQIENLKLFALFFGDVNVELKEMNMLSTDTLVARMVISVTITANTLHYAFPRLNSGGKNGGAQGDGSSILATKMMGKRLVMRGSVRFGWDNTRGQVVRLETRADLLTPILTLLGSLEDVSCVFNGARLTPECQFVPPSEADPFAYGSSWRLPGSLMLLCSRIIFYLVAKDFVGLLYPLEQTSVEKVLNVRRVFNLIERSYSV